MMNISALISNPNAHVVYALNFREHLKIKKKKAKSEVHTAKPASVSGGQRPQLDCNDIEGSPEYGG